jgi:hypothetical protein
MYVCIYMYTDTNLCPKHTFVYLCVYDVCVCVTHLFVYLCVFYVYADTYMRPKLSMYGLARKYH